MVSVRVHHGKVFTTHIGDIRTSCEAPAAHRIGREKKRDIFAPHPDRVTRSTTTRTAPHIEVCFQQDWVRNFESESHLSLRTNARHVLCVFSAIHRVVNVVNAPKRHVNSATTSKGHSGSSFVVVSMHGRLEWVGVMVVGRVVGRGGGRGVVVGTFFLTRYK